MYSAPDFVKISVQQTTAFASDPCYPEWEMNRWSLNPNCTKDTIEGMEAYNCFFQLNPGPNPDA